MTLPFLPYGRQVIEDDDVAAVVRVLRAEMLTTGPEVPAFELRFGEATGAAHAVACNSGTAALHLAAMAIGLGPGTAAVVPSITFLATANAVRLTGAEVVFADVDPDTGLMTAATAAAAVKRSQTPVKAIFPVHLGGQTVDMPSLSVLAQRHGALIIEDACHALGTSYVSDRGTHRVGACDHSVASAFSLHPVKTIAAGEGGVVTFRDASLKTSALLGRNHGLKREGFTNQALAHDANGSANPWYYEMPEPGYNYRLSDIQAALASSQLGKLARFSETRRRLARAYEERLAPLAPVIRPVPRVAGCDPVWHLFQVLVDFDALGIDRAGLMARLREQGVGTQVHYIPVHRQPYYASRYSGLLLSGADAFYRRTLSLPLFAGMHEADVERVVEALESCTRLA